MEGYLKPSSPTTLEKHTWFQQMVSLCIVVPITSYFQHLQIELRAASVASSSRGENWSLGNVVNGIECADLNGVIELGALSDD